MKISLITVCWNSAATLRQTLESVRDQQLPADIKLEYVVIDGESKRDNTVALIEAFAREVADASWSFKYISEPDRGMYDALNKGIALATGDVVGILNADDRFEDTAVLADVGRAFVDAPHLEAVYGDIRFVRGDSTQTTRYYSSRPWRPWMHRWGYMPAHPSVYVRRHVFDSFGNYKLGYHISADFEWMLRIFCRGRIRAQYLPRCMVTMRLGGKSTGSYKKMLVLNRENVRANRENGYFCCLPMMLPKYFYNFLFSLLLVFLMSSLKSL